jgi:hypothetical protein
MTPVLLKQSSHYFLLHSHPFADPFPGKQVNFDDFKRVFIDLLNRESWQNEKEINRQYTCDTRLPHDLTSGASSNPKGDSDSKYGSSMASKLDDVLCYTSTIRYLRAIWKTLNVGGDGFLDQQDLRAVCQGIGMSNTSDEMVNQLFDSLDQDRDGRVSFEELLHGILRHLGTQNHVYQKQSHQQQQRRRRHRRHQRSRHAPESFTSDDVLLIRKSVSSCDITSSRSKESDVSDDEAAGGLDQSEQGAPFETRSRSRDHLHGRLMKQTSGREKEELDPRNTAVLSSDCLTRSTSGLITVPVETSSISPSASSSSVFPIRSSLRHTIPFYSSDFFHLRRAFSDADIVSSSPDLS